MDMGTNAHLTKMESFANAMPEPRTNLKGTVLGETTWVRAYSEVIDSRLGERVFVGYRCKIRNAEIANGTMIASRVYIGDGVKIGENSWVCVGAHIDAGVHIGDRAVVGAGAHLAHDLPPQTVALGRPATRRWQRSISDWSALPSPEPTIRAISKRGNIYAASWPVRAIVVGESYNDASIDGGQGMTVGYGTVLMGQRHGATPHGGIRAGDGVTIGNECVVEASGGLDVGRGTVIGDRVTIVTSSHDYTKLSLPRTPTPISIGNEVTIGDDAILVDPLEIGNGATIGQEHVVTHNVPRGGMSTSIVEVINS